MVNHLKDNIGLSKQERQNITTAIFGKNGLAYSENEVVFETKKNILLEQLAELPEPSKYIDSMLKPTWNQTLSYMWTNNNTESMNHVY